MSKLSMRKISEILRQRYDLKRSYRDIAKSLNISISTVSDYLARAKTAGISWPLPEGMSEHDLYDKLFLPVKDASVRRSSPDWEYIHREMARRASHCDYYGVNIVIVILMDFAIRNFVIGIIRM